MDVEALRALWKTEELRAFRGWDFSHLDGRWQEDDPPWDYRTILRQHLKPKDRLLDMGTGGGEFLLTLDHPHQLTAVTEGYPPNLALCRQRLAPLGIEVAAVAEDDRLPFPSECFDLVINRHESFDPREVWRVLVPGGRFVTQQVGGENNCALSRRVIPDFQPKFPNFTLKSTAAALSSAGFEVFFGDEAFPPLRFFDVGALVYYAKVVEWEFPGFSVDGCLEHLVNCQAEVATKGFLEDAEHRFILAARKL